MTRNKILNLAIYGCRAAQALCISLSILLICVFVHFQYEKDFYKKIDIQLKNSSFQYSKLDTWGSSSKMLNIDKNYIIDTISIPSLYLLFMQYSALLILLFLALKEFKKVVLSLENYSTFQMKNVNSFRRIGNFLFLYLLIGSVQWITFQEGSLINFSLSIAPLCLAIFAFLLAEIFKEGNSLKKENDLTI